ncbi:DUF4249 domain-containing protein [Pontibacter diazotrophicus]|nr:DUF4249 domain-containing protein [Pontibacter diazotrophicus]
MMRKLKYVRTLLLSLPFLLSSCETVVELDLPIHEPQLVVNAVINPDSLFTVDVSASRSPFSNDAYQQLSDASVQVYQAGQVLFDLQHMGNGIYKADTKPQALQHYELQVSAPGFPNASATSYIPAAPVITNIEAERAPYDPNWGLQTTLSFELDDEPEQENFYYIQAYRQDTSYIYERLYDRYISIGFLAPIEQEFSMEWRYFFSDKLFDGQVLPLTLNLETPPEKTTYVQVAHISKEYYEYARTLQRQAGGDDFGNIPTQVTNNIRNGFGLFAGYNAITLAVKP